MLNYSQYANFCTEVYTVLNGRINTVIPSYELTFDVDRAKRIIENKGVKNYSVKSVPKEQVRHELISATYGFIIREDNVVNRVATPTKLSSYISAGVIPIYSSCIRDFDTLSAKYKYLKSVSDLSSICVSDIVEYVKRPIVKEDVKQEFKKIFETYYNKAKHKENLCSLLTKLIPS